MHDMKCPICGDGVLKKEVGNETFEYKGRTTTIANYVTFKCDKCGEAIVDKVALKETGRILKDFQREVDGLLPAREIKRIRKKLSLTQEEMAEILGGGLKGFARYETGQVCQSRGMDNLLRILDAYPDALDVIRKKDVPSLTFQKVIPYEELDARRRYKSMAKDYSVREEGVAYGT